MGYWGSFGFQTIISELSRVLGRMCMGYWGSFGFQAIISELR